jgi:AhpD family alkylhydroperoxidase
MAEVDLEFLEAYEGIYEKIGVRNVHLPLKFKELIAVAVLAVQREDSGLRDHVRRALRLGATKEEITEVLQAAYFHTGALTLVHGLKALLEVLDEQRQAT